jgi:hypothetical protein
MLLHLFISPRGHLPYNIYVADAAQNVWTDPLWAFHLKTAALEAAMFDSIACFSYTITDFSN